MSSANPSEIVSTIRSLMADPDAEQHTTATEISVDCQLIAVLPAVLGDVVFPEKYAEYVVCDFFSAALDQIDSKAAKQTASGHIDPDNNEPFNEAKYADTQILLADLRAYLDSPDADQLVGDLTVEIPSLYDELAQYLCNASGFDDLGQFFSEILQDRFETEVSNLADRKHPAFFIPTPEPTLTTPSDEANKAVALELLAALDSPSVSEDILTVEIAAPLALSPVAYYLSRTPETDSLDSAYTAIVTEYLELKMMGLIQSQAFANPRLQAKYTRAFDEHRYEQGQAVLARVSEALNSNPLELPKTTTIIQIPVFYSDLINVCISEAKSDDMNAVLSDVVLAKLTHDIGSLSDRDHLAHQSIIE